MTEDAPAAWDVLRRSISKLYVADHGNDSTLLAQWLSNKTPEIVEWIAQAGNNLLLVVERRHNPWGRFGDRCGRDHSELCLSGCNVSWRQSGLARPLEARAMERGDGPPAGKFGTLSGCPMLKHLASRSS
jgi:hypothetical protein